MRDGLTRTVSLVMLMLAIPACLLAGRPSSFEWDEVTDQDWAVSEDSANGTHGAVMIFEKVTENDEAFQRYKCLRTEYRRIRILSEAGREHADVLLIIDKASQEIKIIKGRSIQRDGTIVPLQSDLIHTKDITKTEGERITEVKFSMPGVTSDCIIEYYVSYEMRGSVPGWIAQKNIALKYGMYHWLPAKFEIDKYFTDFLKKLGPSGEFATPNYLWLNFPSTPRLTLLPSPQEAKELVFEVDDIPPFNSEPYTLPEASLKARIVTYHGSDANSTTYWGDLASSYEKDFEAFCDKDDRIDDIVAHLKELPEGWGRVDSACAWLQKNITNLSYYDLVDVNDKGEKKILKPNDITCVNDVLKYGYGHRDDINAVFVDILRSLGIHACLSYARDRSEDMFLESIKYPQFNQTIVSVALAAKGFIYFSPGHALLPAGMLPWTVESVRIVIAGADDYMGKTPLSKSSDNTTSTSCSYRIDDDFKLEGTADLRMTGHDARDVRLAAVNKEDSDIDNALTGKLSEMMPNAEIDSVTAMCTADASLPLRLQLRLRYAPLTQTGGRLLFKPTDYLLEFENPFYTDQREQSVLLPYSREQRESAQIEIPDGWSVEALPSEGRFKNSVGSYGIKFTNFGNVVAIERTFVLNSPFWDVKYYDMVRDLFQTAANADNQMVVLVRDTATSGQGGAQ